MKYMMGAVEKMAVDLPQGCTVWQDKRQWAQIETHEAWSEYKAVFILNRLPTGTACVPQQPAVSDYAKNRGLSEMISKGHF